MSISEELHRFQPDRTIKDLVTTLNEAGWEVRFDKTHGLQSMTRRVVFLRLVAMRDDLRLEVKWVRPYKATDEGLVPDGRWSRLGDIFLEERPVGVSLVNFTSLYYRPERGVRQARWIIPAVKTTRYLMSKYTNEELTVMFS